MQPGLDPPDLGDPAEEDRADRRRPAHEQDEQARHAAAVRVGRQQLEPRVRGHGRGDPGDPGDEHQRQASPHTRTRARAGRAGVPSASPPTASRRSVASRARMRSTPATSEPPAKDAISAPNPVGPGAERDRQQRQRDAPVEAEQAHDPEQREGLADARGPEGEPDARRDLPGDRRSRPAGSATRPACARVAGSRGPRSRAGSSRALRNSVGAIPSVATMTPPTAPPTSRATLNWMLLSAIALPTRSRPTISGTSACWAGLPNAFVIPSTKARTPTCQYWTVPAQTSTPRITRLDEGDGLGRDRGAAVAAGGPR